MVSASLREEGRFFMSLDECPLCCKVYDKIHKNALVELEQAILQSIGEGKVGPDFKRLCDEFCQILVDAAGQAQLDLPHDFKDSLATFFAEWTDKVRQDQPPINPWSALVMGRVWTRLYT